MERFCRRRRRCDSQAVGGGSLLAPGLLTARLPVPVWRLPGPTRPSQCSDGSPFEKSSRYPDGVMPGVQVGRDQDSVNSKPCQTAPSLPPCVKPGQPQGLAQKVGFSLGGSDTEVLIGAGAGEMAGPLYPAWLLLVWICPSWLGKSMAVLCPF